MSYNSPAVYVCPGCRRAVEPGEDYVVALEYQAEPGFSLHEMSDSAPGAIERRFHVEHFRGHLGDRLYVLIDESSSGSR
jgi:hypothetical protein